MNDPAIISGSLVDVRNVGTHKSVKLTIHVPEEYATRVVKAFGWPTGANPVSVAIARLESEVTPTTSETYTINTPPPSNVRTASSAGAKSPAQIAGYLCTLPAFQKFLRERHYETWMRCDDVTDMRRASNCVRELCRVDSRADITKDNAEWSALLLAYRLWEREAEVVPA